jgi:hypothetical protein
MKLKVHAETVIDEKDQRLFRDIERMMNYFPKNDDYGVNHRGEKVVLSCHIVARAVGEICGNLVEVTDGLYYPNFNHSWLMTGAGNVIDVYPVGMIGGPILIDRWVAGRRSKKPIYQYREISATEDFIQDWFLKAVRRVARSFRKGIKHEPMQILGKEIQTA